MAKEKALNGVTNKHLHARTAFLYQAATYLTLDAGAKTSHTEGVKQDALDTSKNRPSSPGTILTSHLRAVSRKAQTRLSTKLKRSICKTCDSVLIPGRTANFFTENRSKGGKKPWADVLVIQCNACHSKKRFPVGAERQQRKKNRVQKASTPKSVLLGINRQAALLQK
ncbi:RNAse P Rpr2/Rpp21/SNM1 subunit domain-containing protein [Lophiotrema nucula]|uniref:RNAse P Rpr2/Rpp21/SNM1 subunit domain-containing protein n=1 Tax=Lophiotrema nucula TaxID=690887 RepID=A0A6A5ZCZ6_9PLEO|nr:RNAse P Rpr2/Rpp21/SNM1 subunit domain-containing protein [Lophiotrema nucula]